MINVALCDDCSMQMEVIQTLLDKYQTERLDVEFCIRSFLTGSELLKCVDNGYRFNLFLLDVLMPDLNGMDIAIELRKRDTEVPLIFLTSSKDYALDAFSVSAVQYIIKPITENKLFPVLDRIVTMLEMDNQSIFVLPTQGRIVNIPFGSICYVELVNRALQVNMCDGTSLTGNSLRVSFLEAVASLIKESQFLQVHMSFILNMTQVKEMERTFFTMKNGVQVPISKRKYTGVRVAYLDFLSNHGANFIGG